MGEDFIRKRQQGLKRRTDAEYKNYFKERDLFSGVPPKVNETIHGFLLPGANLSVGVPLAEISEAFYAQTRIVLAVGNERAVEIPGEAAIQLRRAERQAGGPLPKTVQGISPEGVVTINIERRSPKSGDSGGGES
jgi:hypothetical protein